ncbi:MAG: preprotein translocase subunit SecY [Deltaproteobacteria bacterium]|nr:preprotein translocase subunit SecY [Deltaproteobacteria bacterium]MBI3293542.1 preprotein translocase subunit SecY [Deltaproteobacteria bacterium]
MAAVEGLTKIPELRRRILFTIGMLAIYRVGCHIPVPGINTDTLAKFFAGKQDTLFGMLNMFSGRALENASIFALGIMPYISSSIIFQLLTVVVPTLHSLSKEGELGRKKINQYTRYATVLIALFQGFGITKALMSAESANYVLFSGFKFQMLSVITLAAGTSFIMWLGEQITERGVGNGTSLIIFSGIASGIPVAAHQTLQKVKDGEFSALMLVILALFMVVVVGVIIFLEQGQRRIPIQYAKRNIGGRLYGGQAAHLPLKINTSGVIPPIFASSLIMAPLTVLSFWQNPVTNYIRDTLHRGGLVYFSLYVGLIVFFCFFYTAVVFNPDDVAENLKKYGGYVPGIRPGKNTSEYIDKVLSRITCGGALYLSVICILPDFLISRFKVSFFFGGTTLLILVGVALDTVAQIQTFLLTRDYDGFMKNAKLRGRRG